MKKILYFCDFDPSIPGGAQESMKAIIDGLRNDFEFIMVVPETHKSSSYNQVILSKYNNFNIKELSLQNKISLCKDFYKVIRRVKPDLIHVQMTSSMFLVSVLNLLNMISRTPIIYTERGVLDKYGKKMFLSIKLFSKRWTKIITTTEHSKNLYINLLGTPSKKIKVISNTGGRRFINYDESKHKLIRKKYNIEKEELVVMFNGRMNIDKDWNLASKIMVYLIEQYNAKIVIVLGSDKTKENIFECENFVQQLRNQVNPNNLLYFRDLNLDTLQNLYYISDVFILTSKVESFGRTAIEAMSRKNIVFGTNVDGLKEVIKFEEYLYNDYSDFCEKFREFYKNYGINNENKNIFFERYQKNFSFQKNIMEYRKIYLSILEGI